MLARACAQDLFATAKTGRTWVHLNPDESAATLDQPRARITAAIGYLEEKGELTTQVTGLRHGFRLLEQTLDPDKLIADLQKNFADRERQNISRLRRVLAYAEQTGCLTRQLLEYFGENSESDCNDCSRCRHGEGQGLPRTAPLEPGASERAIANRLRAENHSALAHPRQLARFLCGISSPASTRAKLSRHPDFGTLGTFPFQKILKMLTA